MFNALVNKLIPLCSDKSEYPKKLSLVRWNNDDSNKSLVLVVPMPFKKVTGMYDPNCFKYFPSALVQNYKLIELVYKKSTPMVHLRFLSHFHIVKSNSTQ